MKRLLLLVLISYPVLLFANLMTSNQYYFRSWNINDGLSQNSIYAILQDHLGFMWFGTKDGLNRFDGTSFQVYCKANGMLGNNCVTALYEDKEGSIWIGTDTGVYIYSISRENSYFFDVKTADGLGINRSVYMIGENKGCIYISSADGFFCFHPQQQKMVQLKIPWAGMKNFLFDQGTCWGAFYADNLYFTLDDFNTVYPFAAQDGTQPFKNEVVNKIIKGEENLLYVGLTKGLKEINLATRQVRTLLSVDDKGDDIYVREIALYSENELWIGTESGIYTYNIKNGAITHIQSLVGTSYALSDNVVYSLYKDKEGGMWIGSYFGGINYYPKQYTFFEKIYPHKGMEELGERVREIVEDEKGNLWIGTEDKGLFHYNPVTKESKPFHHQSIYHNVHGLCLENGFLWVGTFSGGLNRINLQTNTVKTYRKKDSCGLSSNDIFVIRRTASGKIYLGTADGLFEYHNENDRFSRVESVPPTLIYDLHEDLKGHLWLATFNGVYKLETEKRKCIHFYHKENDSLSLPYDKVLSIFEDSRHQLWFTTEGGGFCRLVSDSGTFEHYDSNSIGLPSDVVHQIVEDKRGIFWLTTNKGLVRFQPETKVIKNFTIADGLLSNQFNYRSSHQTVDGRIYFGCIAGLISFDPSTFIDNDYVSPLVITDFMIFNKEVVPNTKDSPLKQSITVSDSIELTASQNSFSFRFATLGYSTLDQNKLLYKLEGFDKEWYEARGSLISYSNLPYGSYTLYAKGVNSDGIWNDAPLKLHIYIRPPFYLTGWAYAVYVLLSLCIFYFIIRYSKRRMARKHMRQMEKFEQRKERELYSAKINFFTNVAHEIRTPLTLIKGPLECILKDKPLADDVREDLVIMRQNSDRLLNLINQLLDFRKTANNSFTLILSECNIQEIVSGVYIRFTSLARQKNIKLSIDLPEEDISAAVDREALIKIISNLLSNAVKYAATYITITVKYNEATGSFIIKVCNDGSVIPVNMREEIFQPFVQVQNNEEYASGTGLGLALARSLAELHHGTVYLEDMQGVNCFVLEIPVTHVEEVQELQENVSEKEDKISGIENPMAEEQEKGTHLPVILVVEDNQDMLTFIAKQLSSAYSVLKAKDGVEALEILEDANIDLLISDVMMPRMDGMELCHRLKTDLTYSHIPIVLLTAKTNLESKIEGLKLAADAYIEKPFSVEYLIATIESLLCNREKLRQAFCHSPFVFTATMAQTNADKIFLEELNKIVYDNLQDPDFNLDSMAQLLNMSRSSLNRKIRGILDMTPNDYIRVERLKKAAVLLKDKSYKINEVCYAVGFSTPSYFAKCFQKQFGVLPKDFVEM